MLCTNYKPTWKACNSFQNKTMLDIMTLSPVQPPVSHFEPYYMSHAPYGPLSANVTSSTKPEVHNVLHCRQRKTESRPPLTWHAENVVKFRHIVFQTREWADIHSDITHAHHNTSHPYICRGQKEKIFKYTTKWNTR